MARRKFNPNEEAVSALASQSARLRSYSELLLLLLLLLLLFFVGKQTTTRDTGRSKIFSPVLYACVILSQAQQKKGGSYAEKQCGKHVNKKDRYVINADINPGVISGNNDGSY